MDDGLQILKEACRALAQLDADRLEELAAACRALNLDDSPENLQAGPAVELEDRRKQLKVLGRIVEKTRDNLAVIQRVQAQAHRAQPPDVFTRAGLR